MRQSRAAPSHDPDLRSPEAWRRIAAIRRVAASGVDDPEVEAARLDALDDPGVHQHQERDWGNVDDERAMQTVVVRVAEVAVAARDALREYALENLRAPGEPWLVALAVARQLTDEPQIADVVLDRLEAPDPTPELGPLPGLLVVHARAAGPRRAELVRRGALALLSPRHTAREGGALRALVAVDGEAFTAAVLPLLARAQPYDREAWLIAEGLEGAGPAGVTALPTLEALASRMIGWSPIKKAIKTLGRVRASG